MHTRFEDYGLPTLGQTPKPRQMEWYRRGRAAFFHFGINTYYGTEWGDGTEDPARFNPTQLDCEQWIRTIKEAGFTTAILTAKHHDGFCLWPSAYTEHSVKNSPYKNGQGDIVREFVDACHTHGIHPGVYLSPWDRHCPLWGKEEYNQFYADQLTELLTNYGPLYECWWDGAGSHEAHYDWGLWAGLVRQYQPNCIIFGSLGSAPYADSRWVGNECGRGGDPCWGTVMMEYMINETPAMLNSGNVHGDAFIPAECDVSIRPGWFYHAQQDDQVKSPAWLTQYWFDSVGRNAGILLNIPPMPNGLLHEQDMANLKEWKRRTDALFAANLAAGGTVEASSRREDLPAENILLDDKAFFYAPAADDMLPTLTVTLPQPTEIGCFSVQEVIELGHHIRRFAVDALVDGQWRTVAEKECMGYCHADHFPAVTATAVRLRILQADALPVIRFLGVYGDAAPYLLEQTEESIPQRDLAKAPHARVLAEADGVKVELGGIFPFNQVQFTAAGSYTVLSFNGASYEPVATGTAAGHTVCTFDTLEGAYQLKIVAEDIDRDSVQVYCV